MADRYKIVEITTTDNGVDIAQSGSVKATAWLVDDGAPNTPILVMTYYVSGVDVNVDAATLQTRMLAFFNLTAKNYRRAKQLETQGQALLNTLRPLV